MTEQSGQVRVRVVTTLMASGLQGAINSVLEDEQANGAEVVDITLTYAPPLESSSPGMTTVTTPRGEYAALVLLRSGGSNR